MKTTPVDFLAGLAIFALVTLAAPAVPVTFQVNLGHQINNTPATFDPLNDTVEVRGDFYNSWNSGFPLVRAGSTSLYTNTFDITSTAPGGLVQFKFHTYGPAEDNWENLQGYLYPNGYGNRAFTLGASAQTLPMVYFNDQWDGTVLLSVQVDMKPQTLVGNFVPGSDTLEVRGSWDGFSNGVTLTNDPASSASNIYSQTFAIASPAPGGLGAYKFHHYGVSPDTWESIDNRPFTAANPVTSMPQVYFNNLDTNDLLFADTYVGFSVNMANAVGTDNYVFTPGFDGVFINGDFLGWWGWGAFPSPPPQCQLFRVGSSAVYTNTLLVPKGSAVQLNYKYSIAELGWDAADNEGPFKVNHVRYLRQAGSCVFPLDTFGTPLTEPAAGPLSIGSRINGRVNVTWNGHLGLHLQTAGNLTAGSWTDLPATEAQSATNYPVGQDPVFFRLVKP